MPSPRHNIRPSALEWLTTTGSLLLPVAGVALALYGLFQIDRSDTAWYWVGGGVLLILADMFVDWLWAQPSVSVSDEPGLNRRGSELVGQIVTVVRAIERGGRGAVRAADTVWAAEGVPAAAGTRVRVAGVKGTVLIVKRV